MKPLVLYHKNCADGFGAAYAAWLIFKEQGDYLPVQYGEEPPEVKGRQQVFILDFSFKREVLLKMKEEVKELVVLDHHKTAEADLAGLDFCTFDMNKSGAILAWQYFHPADQIPELLLYVQDRDLWQWKLPNSKEVTDALSSYENNFEVWDALDVNLLKIEGLALRRYKDGIIKRSVESNAFEIELDGHKVLAMNSTGLNSEIGEALCQDRIFSVTYFDLPDRRVFSLRSRGDFDVSEIAKAHGGGGHKNAAGFFIKKKHEIFL